VGAGRVLFFVAAVQITMACSIQEQARAGKLQMRICHNKTTIDTKLQAKGP
jgi:hypothetical protein